MTAPIIVLALKRDEARSGLLVDALTNKGLDVWRVQLTDGATALSPRDREHIASARAIVIVWSRSSIDPEHRLFHAIAAETIDANLAISVRIDAVDFPPVSQASSRYDLHGWRLDVAWWQKPFGGELFVFDVVAAATAKAAGKDPPSPKAKREMWLRQAYATIPTLAVLGGFIIYAVGAYNDVRGVMDAPSEAEAAAFSSLPDGDCDRLREFLRTFPDGYHRPTVQARLDGRIQEQNIRYVDDPQSLPVGIRRDTERPRASRALAEGDALTRLTAEAQKICAGSAQARAAQLKRADLRDSVLSCQTIDSGYACYAEGTALCQLSIPFSEAIERCS